MPRSVHRDPPSESWDPPTASRAERGRQHQSGHPAHRMSRNPIPHTVAIGSKPYQSRWQSAETRDTATRPRANRLLDDSRFKSQPARRAARVDECTFRTNPDTPESYRSIGRAYLPPQVRDHEFSASEDARKEGSTFGMDWGQSRPSSVRKPYPFCHSSDMCTHARNHDSAFRVKSGIRNRSCSLHSRDLSSNVSVYDIIIRAQRRNADWQGYGRGKDKSSISETDKPAHPDSYPRVDSPVRCESWETAPGFDADQMNPSNGSKSIADALGLTAIEESLRERLYEEKERKARMENAGTNQAENKSMAHIIASDGVNSLQVQQPQTVNTIEREKELRKDLEERKKENSENAGKNEPETNLMAQGEAEAKDNKLTLKDGLNSLSDGRDGSGSPPTAPAKPSPALIGDASHIDCD